MIVQGQELRHDKAVAMRIVDEVVPAKEAAQGREGRIIANPTAQQPWDGEKFKLPGGPIYSAAGMQVLAGLANAIYRRETYDNYPAAKAILQAVYEACWCPSIWRSGSSPGIRAGRVLAGSGAR